MTANDAFDVIAELRLLKQRFEDFMEKTDEYRKSLCDKMNELKDNGKEMRTFCSEKQKEKARTLYGLLVAFTVPLITLIFICGMLYQRVVFLEKHSYGYRDAVKAMESK